MGRVCVGVERDAHQGEARDGKDDASPHGGSLRPVGGVLGGGYRSQAEADEGGEANQECSHRWSLHAVGRIRVGVKVDAHQSATCDWKDDEPSTGRSFPALVRPRRGQKSSPRKGGGGGGDSPATASKGACQDDAHGCLRRVHALGRVLSRGEGSPSEAHQGGQAHRQRSRRRRMDALGRDDGGEHRHEEQNQEGARSHEQPLVRRRL
mmetsp:Transcript_22407/g.72749  ORF Transcript_22407/g.72749 Transcript_22407/m.72749 type:complete len:208 (+) Transcript_22407:524-1147(+)